MFINRMEVFHEKCLMCGSNKLNPLKGYESKYLVRCGSCDFIFTTQIPQQDAIDKYYGTYPYAEYNIPLTQATHQSFEKLLKLFDGFRKTNKILDVGCGRGDFLVVAKSKGWEVYGTELSGDSVKICSQKGIKVLQGVLNPDQFDKHDFDVIFFSEVIEHITTPVQEVKKFYELLRPGGLLYITTPNFNSLLRYYYKVDYNVIMYPEHLCYFTPKTMNAMLKENGFKKYKLLTTGISFSRIINSSKKKNVEHGYEKNTDDQVREMITSNPFLKLIKSTVNFFLNITKTGLTLKAGYVKK